MYTIYVDNGREKRLAEAFQQLTWVNDSAETCQLKEQRLEDGDVQVFLWRQLILIIERKRVRDLSDSSKDGRLFNCWNMDLLARQKEVKLPMGGMFRPMTVLAVEGRFQKASKRCLSKAELESNVDQLRYELPALQVIYTQDIQGTAKRIGELIHNMPGNLLESLRTLTEQQVGFVNETKISRKRKVDVVDVAVDNDANVKKQKKPQKAKRYALYGNQMKLHQKLLRMIPGVSVRISLLMLKAGITAFDVLLKKIGPGDLTQLRYIPSNVSVPLEKANKICASSVVPEQTLVKLFKSVPHVKNKAAPQCFARIVLRGERGDPSDPPTAKQLFQDPECKKHKISLVTVERIWTTFLFRPH